MRIAPDTDAWRLLQLMAERDGQLDVQALAGRLYPWVATPIPRAPGALLARRAARGDHDRRARGRVRAHLRRLVRAGLVAPMGPVELWPDAAERWRSRGPDSLARWGGLATDGPWLAPTPLEPPSRHAVAIVAALAASPQSYCALATVSGGRTPAGAVSGAWSLAYRRLCDEQVVRPPRARRLTPDGWRAVLASAA